MVPHEKQRVAAWQERAGEGYSVVADGGYKASSRYGVAFQMRIHTDTSNTPGAFLIDREGILRFAHIGKGPRNFADRPELTDLLSAIDSWSSS